MRAHNTALATRSIRRFQERDEPTDATRGVGTVPRNQRPRPAAPGRAPCPDLPSLRLSRRPLPSARLLLLQKQQVSLRREVESGGLAQPPVAAPVLSRAERSRTEPGCAVPETVEKSRAELRQGKPRQGKAIRAERRRSGQRRSEPVLPPRLQQEALPGAAAPAPGCGPESHIPRAKCRGAGVGRARSAPPSRPTLSAAK